MSSILKFPDFSLTLSVFPDSLKIPRLSLTVGTLLFALAYVMIVVSLVVVSNRRMNCLYGLRDDLLGLLCRVRRNFTHLLCNTQCLYIRHCCSGSPTVQRHQLGL